MNYPKISIVTPSFNQGTFIEKTINSILDQNYPNLEYIIIDGGSTDNTVNVIKKYERHLKYWVSEPDRGQSHAINKGLNHCSGEIFNWMNSDDYLEPNALFQVCDAYKKNPQSSAWIGATKRLHSNGFLHYISYPNGLFIEHISLSIPSRCLYQPSCFFNLNYVKELNGVREDLHYSMDLELYIRLSKKGSFTRGEGIWSTAIAHPDAKTVKNVRESNLEKKKLYQEYNLQEPANAADERANHIFKYRIPDTLLKQFQAQENFNIDDLKIPYSFAKRNVIIINSDNAIIDQYFIDSIINTYTKIFERFSNIKFIISHPKSETIKNNLRLENVYFNNNFDEYLNQTKIFINLSNKSNLNIKKIIDHGIPIIANKEITDRHFLVEGESCFTSDNIFDTTFKAILLTLDPSVWGNISAQSLLVYNKNDQKYRQRVLFYFFKNVHIPILLPLYNALKAQNADVDIAFSYLPPSPEIRAGLLPNEVRIIEQAGVPIYATAQQFLPDLTFIADSVYPWVEGCGKLVHVGHGVLSKGQYYTDTPTARREELADLVCVPGKHHQGIMRRIITKPVVATGMCKLDDLFSGKINRASVIKQFGLPDDYRYVLYAPTFNDELSAIPFIKDRIGDVLPGDKTLLIVKLHPSTKPEYKDMYRALPSRDKRIIFADELDITPFLALCDVMISDVSSALMEFAALDKPVILFNNPNWTSYQNYNPADIEFQWRDIGIQVADLDEMREAVSLYLQAPALHADKRKKYTDLLFANKRDGNAAQRIVKLALSLLEAEQKR